MLREPLIFCRGDHRHDERLGHRLGVNARRAAEAIVNVRGLRWLRTVVGTGGGTRNREISTRRDSDP